MSSIITFLLLLMGLGVLVAVVAVALMARKAYKLLTGGHTTPERAARQRRTARTADGVTVEDRRSPEEAQKKIFGRDEGEYVDFVES